MKMKEDSSYSVAISVSIATNSSIPDENSGVVISINSGYDYAFRGIVPTEFYFKFIPSV